MKNILRLKRLTALGEVSDNVDLQGVNDYQQITVTWSYPKHKQHCDVDSTTGEVISFDKVSGSITEPVQPESWLKLIDAHINRLCRKHNIIIRR